MSSLEINKDKITPFDPFTIEFDTERAWIGHEIEEKVVVLETKTPSLTLSEAEF